MTCAVCSAPLTGGIDTFGLPTAPLCMVCWFEVIEVGKQAVADSNEFAKSVGLPPMDVDELEAGTMALTIGEEL